MKLLKANTVTVANCADLEQEEVYVENEKVEHLALLKCGKRTSPELISVNLTDFVVLPERIECRIALIVWGLFDILFKLFVHCGFLLANNKSLFHPVFRGNRRS